MPGPAVEWPAWRTPAAASRRPPVTSTTHRLHAWIVSWSHRGGIVPVEELAGNLDVDAVYGFIRRLFTGYTRTLPAYRRRLLERFTLTRVARKVVGVGSVGTEAWILLMEPDDGVEPLLLLAKQSQRSVLADYAGQSEYHNQGERVVAGQQLMQAVSDIFLGWQSATPPGRRSADPVPQDLHHPPRAGPRRHLPGTRGRPVRLLRDLPARPDHRHAGRPGRRGGHLR